MPRARLFDPNFVDAVRHASPIQRVINADLLAAGHPALTGHGDELHGWDLGHDSVSGTSLAVNTAKEVFYCFSCGASGSVFEWTMRAHQCSFADAVTRLATQANIPFPDLDPREQEQWQQVQQERHALEGLFRAAADFFASQLTQEHLEFCLRQWGLRPDTVITYRLGFAPVAEDALQAALRSQGFDDALIRMSGLVIRVDGRWLDFFQGRLVLPFWQQLPDPATGRPGTPCYFTGRRLDGVTPDQSWEEAKYRTQLTHGDRHPYVSEAVVNGYLFGEHTVYGLANRPLLVTEGVGDCVAALQAGFPAISPATVQLSRAARPRLLRLARLAKTVLLCNDNEPSQAGLHGALATAAFLDTHGVNVRVVTLPRADDDPKVDLATYLQSHAAEDLQVLCDQAQPYLDARLATYPVSGDGFSDSQAARQFVTEVLTLCPEAQRALAFLRYRVRAYFALHTADVDDLTTLLRDQQRQHATHRIPRRGRLGEDPEDTTDRDGLVAHVGDVEDLDTLAAGARRDDDTRPPEERYRATPAGLVWVKPTKDGPEDVLLSNFTATITAESTHDDGAETRKRFTLTACLHGKTYTLDIPEAQFASMGWVTRELGAKAVVMPGMTLRDHTRAAVQLLSRHIAHHQVYEHTSWRVVEGERCYLHHGGAITAHGARDDVRVALTGSLARYRLPAPPTGAVRRAAVMASLGLRTLLPASGMVPVLGVVYLAPLRELLDAEPPDFTLWVAGRSGLFKSEIAALAQAHWGDFTRMTLPASFVATGNALERLTFATKDALLVCDDYFPARNRREADAMDQNAARLLRGIGNGSGRSRMRQDTTARPDLPPRGLTLATGERLPEGQSTNARLFLLSLNPLGQEDVAPRLARAQADRGQYALAMRAYLQWLAHGWDDLHAALPSRFQTLRQLALAARTHFRQPSQLAYLQLAWEVFTAFAQDVGALDGDDRTIVLQDTWAMGAAAAQEQSQDLRDAAPERRFLALLADGFASKSAYLEDLQGDCPEDGEEWGWVRVTRVDREGTPYVELRRPTQGVLLGHAGEDWVYLFPEQAYQFVARAAREANSVFPVELTTLLKRLDETGAIATAVEAKQVRRTVHQRIRERLPRVIKLRRTAITGVIPAQPQGVIPSSGTAEGSPQPTNSSSDTGDIDHHVPNAIKLVYICIIGQ